MHKGSKKGGAHHKKCGGVHVPPLSTSIFLFPFRPSSTLLQLPLKIGSPSLLLEECNGDVIFYNVMGVQVKL